MLKAAVLVIIIAIGSQANAQQSDSLSECEASYSRGSNLAVTHHYRAAVDTLRAYVESCANIGDASKGFTSMTGSVQALNEPDTVKYREHRDWIRKVLFLNTVNPNYYCRAVSSLFVSFNEYAQISGTPYDEIISLMDYVLESRKCPEYDKSHKEQRIYLRGLQYRIWADSVKDSMATPFDTTTHSLEQMGLEWIRGTSSVASQSIPHSSYHGDLAMKANPFEEVGELMLDALREGYFRIELFDALGREHLGWQELIHCDRGSNRIRIRAEISQGKYFLRVSTPLGEVRTLQLQKLD